MPCAAHLLRDKTAHSELWLEDGRTDFFLFLQRNCATPGKARPGSAKEVVPGTAKIVSNEPSTGMRLEGIKPLRWPV
jgi:hypothetical protein